MSEEKKDQKQEKPEEPKQEKAKAEKKPEEAPKQEEKKPEKTEGPPSEQAETPEGKPPANEGAKEKKRKKIRAMAPKELEAKLRDVKEKMGNLRSRYAKQLLKQKEILEKTLKESPKS